MKIKQQSAERHVLAITVDNEAGILAKIAGLFTARGYNIDSLTVADISDDHAVSRITIVTNGPPAVIDQIQAQLERLVPVHKVVDLTEEGPHRRKAGRSTAPRRHRPRAPGRHHHRKLHLRNHRSAGQARQLHRTDARTRAG